MERSVVVLCHVALDERNGGGMRTLLGYLSKLADRAFVSVHFGDTDESGDHGLTNVTYRRLDKRPFPVSLASYASRLRDLRRRMGDDPLFLLFPNTKDDVQLCLAATFVSRRTCVWLMDDFISTVFPCSPGRRFGLGLLFRSLYRRAARRIAISGPMRREYDRRYGGDADLVLGKRWRRDDIWAAPARRVPISNANPLRLVWVGKYQVYYHQPIAALSDLLKKHPELPLRLDLYGQVAPPTDVLVPGRLEYRGGFEDESLLEILREYDFGLLTYSFDAQTRAFMRYSFPGKLTDYVSAGLPVITISPRDMSVCDDLLARTVGPCAFSLSQPSLWESLEEALKADAEQLETWRRNSLAWAREEFVFEDGLVRFKELIG